MLFLSNCSSLSLKTQEGTARFKSEKALPSTQQPAGLYIENKQKCHILQLDRFVNVLWQYYNLSFIHF